ncbi:hypothetical protein [Pedobacter sp.]
MVKKIVFLALVMGIALLGCKKDKVVEEPKPTGFVEFKIDGKQFHIDDYGTSSVLYQDDPSVSIYQIIFTFYGKDNLTMPLLHQISNSPLSPKKYTYTGYNVNQIERPHFSFSVEGGKYIYSFSVLEGMGEIEFTRLDRHAGGKVEGKFHFTNVDYKDKDLNLLSRGHKLTDGIFSIVVK